MVFCNKKDFVVEKEQPGHNPYFNRWFSAICSKAIASSASISHNPYFNRWFSAMFSTDNLKTLI